MKRFEPVPRYKTKLYLILTIVAVLVLIGAVLLGWLISFDSEADTGDVTLIVVIIAIADLVWWIPAMLLVGPYYRSLSYEVQDDEVIVKVGIWTKSVKHVPYRTVTNLKVQRDIFDRWFFDIGSLNIQTAGMSGNTGAEESLVGLPNVQEVYDIVATQLRRFRGGMAPTGTDVEEDGVAISSGSLDAILDEVREIKQILSQREQ